MSIEEIHDLLYTPSMILLTHHSNPSSENINFLKEMLLYAAIDESILHQYEIYRTAWAELPNKSLGAPFNPIVWEYQGVAMEIGIDLEQVKRRVLRKFFENYVGGVGDRSTMGALSVEEYRVKFGL